MEIPSNSSPQSFLIGRLGIRANKHVLEASALVASRSMIPGVPKFPQETWIISSDSGGNHTHRSVIQWKHAMPPGKGRLLPRQRSSLTFLLRAQLNGVFSMHKGHKDNYRPAFGRSLLSLWPSYLSYLLWMQQTLTVTLGGP